MAGISSQEPGVRVMCFIEKHKEIFFSPISRPSTHVIPPRFEVLVIELGLLRGDFWERPPSGISANWESTSGQIGASNRRFLSLATHFANSSALMPARLDFH